MMGWYHKAAVQLYALPESGVEPHRGMEETRAAMLKRSRLPIINSELAHSPSFKVLRYTCIQPSILEAPSVVPLTKLEGGGIGGMMTWSGLTCNWSFFYEDRLDRDRLQAALVKVANAHPILAGQMFRMPADDVEDHHTSSLAVCTNGTGFPFIVASMEGMTLQQLISHGCYLHGLPFTPFGQVAVQGPEWMQTLDAAQIAAGASPLIAFRLTYLEGSSACILSVAASHAIVDGMRLFGVLTDVVAAYRYSCSIARRPTDRGVLHPEALAACPHLDGQRIRAYLAAAQQQHQQHQQAGMSAAPAAPAAAVATLTTPAASRPAAPLDTASSITHSKLGPAPASAPVSRHSSISGVLSPSSPARGSLMACLSATSSISLAPCNIYPTSNLDNTASLVTLLLPESTVLRLKANVMAAAAAAAGKSGGGSGSGSMSVLARHGSCGMSALRLGDCDMTSSHPGSFTGSFSGSFTGSFSGSFTGMIVSTNDVVNALLWMLRKEMAGLPLPGCSSPEEGEEEEALNQTIDILANGVPESAVPPNYLGNAVCIMRTVAPVFEACRGCRAQDFDAEQLKSMHVKLSMAIRSRLSKFRSDPMNALDMGLRWWRSSLLGSGSETMAGIRKGVTAISTNLTRVSGPALDFSSGAPVSSLLLTSPLQCAIPAPFNGISKAPYGDGVMLHMCVGELPQLWALEASHVLSKLAPEAQLLY